MADFNSSLPVRTQDAGDVIAKLADATIPSQQLAISASGAAKVDGSAVIQPVSATDLDIRDLSSATDSVTVVATDLDIRDLAFATDKVDVSGSSVTATATDLDIRDLSAAQDSVSAWISDATGAAFSPSNPLPVAVQPQDGDPITDFKDASSIGAGSSDAHVYTVSGGKTLYLQAIEASASGKAKMLLEIETGVGTNTFTSIGVQLNSTASPNMSFKLTTPIAVAAGVKVQVTMTNRDLAAQDLYSTILGYEI